MRHLRPTALAALALLASPSLRADLESYVKAPDPSFNHEVKSTFDLPGGGKAVLAHMTSQTWHGIPWEHWLAILRPETVQHPKYCLLLVAGGSKKSEPPSSLSKEAIILAGVAAKLGIVVAVLPQVPNQPLFENMKEDALIAHTFVKFFETGDETWPCLLPMAKSAVRGMDAVQAIVKKTFDQDIERFVVTGASKRGWTTWLTAAVDPRVVAIAPMVIDTLNMQKQMALQRLSFGGYSEQIEDYTSRNLQARMQDPRGKRLLELVDPYSFTSRLSMPKLIILGTNDRYWPVDAVKLYFPDLPGEKLIHYVPNKGHGLGAEAVDAIMAFTHAVITGEPKPRFEWSLAREAGQAILSVKTQDPPESVEIWRAEAPTRDFREAKWTSAPAEKSGDLIQGKVPVPEKGYTAFFGRLVFKTKGGFLLAACTNVEVLGDPPPARP